ncbi:MAG: hypothetical protein JWN44_36, partial [Myxococcales bacterium]|nr:hypothetical protein [Myxococcales bacterium]
DGNNSAANKDSLESVGFKSCANDSA